MYPVKKEVEITDIISFFHLKCPRNFSFEGESHDFWEFVYIDKGQLVITAGEEEYVLKAGELAFHKPNEFHAIRAHEGISSNAIVSAFVCKSPSMKYFEHRFTSVTEQERQQIYQALKYAQSAWKEEATSFGCLQVIQIYLELLLLNILRRDESMKINTRIESYVQQRSRQETVDKVHMYLEKHISENLTLEQISNDLGYSISQIKKLYRIKMGCGIIDSFISMKMDEAKRLLAEGTMNINQISSYLGYENPAYFSTVFKKRVDMTPSEYARSFVPGEY